MNRIESRDERISVLDPTDRKGFRYILLHVYLAMFNTRDRSFPPIILEIVVVI